MTTVTAAIPPVAGVVRPRIQSLDLLRGAVMILMALDHVRDFFHAGAQHFDPTDFTQTTPLLFLTRWITHFCAPTFIFLAGTGAYLQSRRGKSNGEIARFLITRGLWLVVLELTVVRWLGWRMNFGNDQIFLLVIWVLGVSMIALAGLIYVPWKPLLALSVGVILLHNTLDGIPATQFGPLGWLWVVLHAPGTLTAADGVMVYIYYTLVPWVFVMSAGFCFGRVMDLNPQRRRHLLLALGSGMIIAFVVLRWTNLYGDPQPWSIQATGMLTVAAFGNATKYPPSLLYLLMTLGPALLILAVTEHVRVRDTNPLIVFGRVPLFYYLLHIPLIHALAAVAAAVQYGRIDVMLRNPPAILGPPEGFPPDYGYGLAVVYVMWIVVVALLYPLCRWFAGVKQRNKAQMLSYL
jgi:uncharacterized membrane protein